MTETAAEIIANTGEEIELSEETDEETPTIEEEFRDLKDHFEGLVGRLNKVATTLEKVGNEPATKKDLATLYRFVGGDLVNSVNDLVAACGAAFNDTFEMLDSETEEETEEEDENTPSEEDIQVYTTFVTNIEAFTNLAKAPGLTGEQKNAFDQIISLNQSCLNAFNEAYGEQNMKDAAASKISEAATSGSEDS